MSIYLKTESIKLVYQTPESETLAIKDVSFTVDKGQFVSIVGPSGCGKSTLLSCIAGITLPTSGTILLENKPINGITGR